MGLRQLEEVEGGLYGIGSTNPTTQEETVARMRDLMPGESILTSKSSMSSSNYDLLVSYPISHCISPLIISANLPWS